MDETDQTKGRRGFLKKLLGVFVAPKVAASVPVPEKPVNALWKQALVDYEMPMNVNTALGVWLGRQKAKEIEEYLREGKPLPMRQVYGIEFQDEPDEPEEDEAYE